MRKSNFELLRIVAMLLVLLVHYIPTRGEITPEAFQSSPWSTVFNIELKSLSFVCVNCFVLISGYFGIKLRMKSFCNLIFQMAFWSAFCIVFAIYCPLIDISQFSVPKAFVQGISWGWFVQGYLILFLVSPLLNLFVESNSSASLGKYLLIFYAFSTIGGYLMGWDDFHKGMSALSLVGIYLTGAYLRKSEIRLFAIKPKYCFLMYLLGGGVLLVINVLLISFGISASPYGYLNPVVILMSVYLFLFFKGLKIGYVCIINYFAASAFSIYLFHCNVCLGGEISDMWKAINIQFGTLASFQIACLSFIGIYLFCVVVDRVRIVAFNIISKKLFK